MTMGYTKRENGMLKLVHPGGFVEFHKEPITAAQVMEKNPRHCVTRSDVFKHPWIVVRPDSVLKLGTVFFIVPNHTLYRLLQASKDRRQSSALQVYVPPKGSNDIPRPKQQQSRSETWSKVFPKQEEKPVLQQSGANYFLEWTSGLQLHEEKVRNESWSDATQKQRDGLRIKHKYEDGLVVKETPKLPEQGCLLKHLPCESRGETTSRSQEHAGHSKQQSRFESKVTPELQNHDPSLQLVPADESLDDFTPNHGSRGHLRNQLSLVKFSKHLNHFQGHQREPSVGCWGETTPKCRDRENYRKRQTPIEAWCNVTFKGQTYDPDLQKQYSDKSRYHVDKLSQKLLKEEPNAESFVHVRPACAQSVCVNKGKGGVLELPPTGPLNPKPCLRKPNDEDRSSREPKVRFRLPNEEDKGMLKYYQQKLSAIQPTQT